MLYTVKKIFEKYWNLFLLTVEEFKRNGAAGVSFAVKRHLRKRFEKSSPGGEFVSRSVNYQSLDCGGVNPCEDNGKVTIAILSKDRLDLIRPCIESIQQTLKDSRREAEILIGDTGTTDSDVWDYYKEIRSRYNNLRIVNIGRYHFSRNYNQLIGKYAQGEYVILLNNDTKAKDKWLDELVNPLEDKRIGAVGAKLIYADGTIQHAGMKFRNDNAYHLYVKRPRDIPEANFAALIPTVTFACVALRRDVFNRFGLCEDFLEECQDTDFCLRLGEAGFKILYNPRAEIFHFEGSSRDLGKISTDRELLKAVWGKKMENISKQKQIIKFTPHEYDDAITIHRDDGIGDLLMGVSVFKQLREKNPGKKVILATFERNIEMMRGFGIFDEFVAIPNGQRFAPVPIPTRGRVYKLSLMEISDGKYNKYNKMHRHPAFTELMELDQKYEFVPMPDYPEARHKVKEMLKSMGIDVDQKFVVLNLVSTNPARSWWEPYYPKLIGAIEDLGFTPLVVGTVDSNYFKGEKVVNLTGKTKSITEYIEAIKLSKCVISTDTSAYHIAALSNIPFLAIFTGGVKPEARVKYYEKYEFCEPPESLVCYPCWDEGCKNSLVHWAKEPCRLAIKPEEVIEKFEILVKKYLKD